MQSGADPLPGKAATHQFYDKFYERGRPLPKVKQDALDRDAFSHFSKQALEKSLSTQRDRHDRMKSYQWQLHWGYVNHREKQKK